VRRRQKTRRSRHKARQTAGSLTSFNVNLGAFFAAANLKTPQKTGLYACIFCPIPYNRAKGYRFNPLRVPYPEQVPSRGNPAVFPQIK
jgi:hypothetical protein